MDEVLLNGEYVDGKLIDPKKHRFVGMFRKNYAYYRNPKGIVMCPCGAVIQTTNGIYTHWIEGHFDIPQYIDIKE